MTNELASPDRSPLYFAGRETIFARLQQSILDPPHRHALVFTGVDGSGKTALLRQFNTVFGDTLLGVYLPLNPASFDDENIWLWRIISGINAVLEARQFSLSRVPELDEDSADDVRGWLRNVFLPQVFAVIRASRRLVLLLDDAEHLTKAPDGHLAYLHELLLQFPQLAIVVTIDSEQEHLLDQFAPLVDPNRAERLERLTLEAVTDLIRHYAPGASDSLVEEVMQATGGQPRLVTRYGQALAAEWTQHSESAAQELARPRVYEESLAELIAIWQSLPRDERLVLTAIAGLIYDDPRHAVMPQRIETWLVETDYPMDRIAINAALRGLDYREIVHQQAGGGITLVTGLMQRWLLEHARLEDDATTRAPRDGLPLRAILIVGLVLLAVLIAFFLLPSPVVIDTEPVATATLVP